jgi:hypothetical protein
MGQALPLDLDRLLGGASPVRAAQPIDSGAVHCDGIVDIARLIPRAAPQREKARRSILVDRARA